MSFTVFIVAAVALCTVTAVVLIRRERLVKAPEPPARRETDKPVPDGELGLYELCEHLVKRLDRYDELLATSARNFRTYRRNARIAFGFLVAMSVGASALAVKTGRDFDVSLANGLEDITRINCDVGNDLRGGLRIVVEAALPNELASVRELALVQFADRDCDAVVAALPNP